mmetsp:Transcript_12599/g.33836  ORF Transcript_12599/g.33836 Transcript_12599/m.33836 type:complete len:212 (-) Transcript_12599:2511-3146(-)
MAAVGETLVGSGTKGGGLTASETNSLRAGCNVQRVVSDAGNRHCRSRAVPPTLLKLRRAHSPMPPTTSSSAHVPADREAAAAPTRWPRAPFSPSSPSTLTSNPPRPRRCRRRRKKSTCTPSPRCTTSPSASGRRRRPAPQGQAPPSLRRPSGPRRQPPQPPGRRHRPSPAGCGMRGRCRSSPKEGWHSRNLGPPTSHPPRRSRTRSASASF